MFCARFACCELAGPVRPVCAGLCCLSANMSSRRVAIVTGSNKGIGLAVVRALCKQFDGDVYLTSRDVGRGQAALEGLKKEGLSPLFHQLDINNPASIHTARDFFKTQYGGVDVLINNAGIAFKGKPGTSSSI